MSAPSRGAIARGVAWVAVASALVAVFDLIALAVILRLWVTSEEFGTVSIVVTAFGALQLLAQAGLPAAIVARAIDDDDRLSTAYWLGCAGGLVVYALLWCAAPLIAGAYDRPVIVPLVRVVGLVLLLRPLQTTHDAVLRRGLRFRELSTVRVVANAIELAVKLGTAAAGGGLWAFALGPVARELTYAIGIPLVSRWRPRLRCRPALVRDDLRFGVRATGGELLYQLYSNLDYQVVAYAYGPAALGLYRAAYELVLEPVRFVSGVVTVVAFPTFARLRDNRPALRAQFIAFTRQNLMVVLLLVAIIVVGAGELLGLMFGPDYAAVAPIARILAIVGVLRALGHLGPPLLDGVGRPDLSLRYQLTATLVMSTGFVLGGALGSSVTTIALAWALGYPLAFTLLWTMVLGELALSAAAYGKRIARVVAAAAVAGGAGAVVHAVVPGVGVRLAASSVTILAVGLALLAWLEQVTPRALVRSLRA